jgi:uncharacterized membrane protein
VLTITGGVDSGIRRPLDRLRNLRSAIYHALLSYLFCAVILAIAISTAAALLGR